MIPKLLFTLLGLSLFTALWAARVEGTVTNERNQALSYASVTVKGGRGTTTNGEGRYFIELPAGTYQLEVAYVGYQKQERSVTIGTGTVKVDFILTEQPLSLPQVIVQKGGEDPAYAIIRQAIKKRSFYAGQVSEFSFGVYTKGIMRTRDIPKKVLGQKVDMEDGDTSKKKIIYLSETFSEVFIRRPREVKVVVKASKVSGDRDGYGLAAPQVISMYQNNVYIGNINPRGFISPISDNALAYYRYRFAGTFYEDGLEISRIQVIPRRNYEPLFSGYIQITENDWRIHSVDLLLTKTAQMELLDSLRIEQLYVPVSKEVWMPQTQVLRPVIKILGFDIAGSFVNSYSDWNLKPNLGKKFFDNTVLTFQDSANRQTDTFWTKTRPLELQPDEVRDYVKKDSLERRQRELAYLDSLDRRGNKLSPVGILLTGQTFSRRSKRISVTFEPVIRNVQFNTVEGWNITLNPRFYKRLDTLVSSRRAFTLQPTLRYGFSNRRWNADLSGTFFWGTKYASSVSLSGGRTLYQLNNANPVNAFTNTINSLWYETNFMKVYDAWQASATYSTTLAEGLTATGSIEYQDRMPLENTTSFTWKNVPDIIYTPNRAVEIMSSNFLRHQALIAGVGLRYRPGNRYMQLPGRKISLGSRFPIFELSVRAGINDLAGSDVNYQKWLFGIRDDLNLKIGGRFQYRVYAGGFISRKSIQVQDLTHFSGNRMLLAEDYLNSFQLAPYYKFSNSENFYTRLHVEHHFNGLGTNKIPFFRTLNWHLVAGANSFLVNRNNHYVEGFVGIENIFKILRVDYVQALESGNRSYQGIRIGFSGLIGRRM